MRAQDLAGGQMQRSGNGMSVEGKGNRPAFVFRKIEILKALEDQENSCQDGY